MRLGVAIEDIEEGLTLGLLVTVPESLSIEDIGNLTSLSPLVEDNHPKTIVVSFALV